MHRKLYDILIQGWAEDKTCWEVAHEAWKAGFNIGASEVLSFYRQQEAELLAAFKGESNAY